MSSSEKKLDNNIALLHMTLWKLTPPPPYNLTLGRVIGFKNLDEASVLHL